MRTQYHPPSEVDIYTDDVEPDSTQKCSNKIKFSDIMTWIKTLYFVKEALQFALWLFVFYSAPSVVCKSETA